MTFSRLRLMMTAAFILPFAHAFAQMDSAALSEEYYKQGMEVYGFAHRKQAAELFVMATQMNPRNAKAQLMAGQSIMLTIQKEQSLDYFRRAWKLDPKVDENILYFLGQAYHYSEKFDSAILFYDRYNRLLARSLDLEKSNKINEVNRKIFECRNAQVYVAHPVKVTITNLDGKINSEYPDYAPTISEDEQLMVFTSRRPGDNLNERVATDLEYYEEIFVSEKVNGAWQQAKNPGPPLNTGYHNASVNLSPDGKEIIIYHDTNGGDLLLSLRNADGTWSSPRPMEGINTEYLESSATITEDDRTIYFTSNRPGGYGGTDIYSCELGKGGRWINVKNLGPQVNTEMDEEGVFISANSKHLYFSSNGLAGMGDLDIYRSTWDEEKKDWGEPVNLGYPINSPENDIYFVLTADEKFAYLSSLRKDNQGEQDIYKIDMSEWRPVYLDQPEFFDVFADPMVTRAPQTINNMGTPVVAAVAAASAPTNEPGSTPVQPLKAEPAKSRSKGRVNITWAVLNDETGTPIETEVDFRDGRGKYVNVSRLSAGEYKTSFEVAADSSSRYRVNFNTPEFIPYTSSFYFSGTDQDISETVRLKRIPVNTHVVNVGYAMNVYFSHDGVEPLSFDGIRNLLDMMKASPTMRVEIGGHTDAFGPDAYNLNLSRRRAENVRKYLIKGGADPSRVTAVGYGEGKPKDTNETMEGRRLNRRIEFTILQQ